MLSARGILFLRKYDSAKPVVRAQRQRGTGAGVRATHTITQVQQRVPGDASTAQNRRCKTAVLTRRHKIGGASAVVRNRRRKRGGVSATAQARRCDPRQREPATPLRATHTITRVQQRVPGGASTARNPQHEKNGCRAAVFN